MANMKRLIVAVVILAVIAVMALRGCPRVRKSMGIVDDSSTVSVTALQGQLEHSFHPL